MGQYFNALVIEKHDDNQMVKVQVLNPRDYKNFSKLTESSFIGNDFVNAVMGLINGNPRRVAWIGDYSDDVYGDPYEKKISHDEFMRYYSIVWEDGYEDDDAFVVTPEPMKFDRNSKGWYLVNHTQGAVLSLDDFISHNSWVEKFRNYETGEEEERLWCMSPLPLLTACGNGRGGGDYHEGQPDYEKVGAWAFDLIELTQEKPEGYIDVMYGFKEEW